VGSIPELQERLKNFWKFHQKFQQLKNDQSYQSTNYKEAMIKIDQAVPCILHCEMRVGEKIVRMLLIEGLNSIPKKRIIQILSIMYKIMLIHPFWGQRIERGDG
jgi:hypothetical protein